MELGLTRRNIARLVLLAWAVMLAWLARREFTRDDSARAGDRAMRLAPAAQYFGVHVGGKQIGQLNLTVDTLVDGVLVREMLVLDVPAGRATGQLSRNSEFTLSRSLRLRAVSISVVGFGPQERLLGEVGSDSTLRLTQTEAPLGAAGRSRVRVDPDDVVRLTLPFRLAYTGRLRVGASLSLPLLDLDGSAGTAPVAVRVTAESTFVVPDSAVWDSAGSVWVPATTDTIHAWRIEHDAPGAPTISWVDAGGVLVHQETVGGATLIRSAFEIVRNNYRALRRTEPQAWRQAVPGMLTLVESGRIPDTLAESRAYLVASDSGTPRWGGTRAVSGGRQQWREDTVFISRATPPDTAAVPPPAVLDATWDLPTRDGGIEAVAIEALVGARTGEDSARRLTRWVAREIATDTGARASATALFTLRARRGTAEGKARLLAAMARSRGLPARVVSGLALLPEGSFGHSWTELWVGRWIAADPAYGHFPASASLLRLSQGGGSRPLDLVILAGSARFLPIRPHR